MIKEIIHFAQHTFGSTTSSRVRPMKNEVVVVRLSQSGSDSSSLQFDSYTIFRTDEELSEFMKTVPDLDLQLDPNRFRNWLNDNIEIWTGKQGGNKKLGSKSGLMTCVPHAFRLSKNLLAKDFNDKLDKTTSPSEGWKSQKEFQDKLMANIKKAYSSFWERAKNDGHIPKENSLVFALLPETVNSLPRKQIYSMFSNDRKSEPTNTKAVDIKGICPICNNELASTFIEGDTYNPGKPFLRRLDRTDDVALRVCLGCAINYKNAVESIGKAGFRIFPIFERDIVPYELMMEDGKAKGFGKIFEELDSRMKLPEYNFQLVALSHGKIWLCDYVGAYCPFFREKHYSRFQAQGDFWNIVTGRNMKFYPYFEELPKEVVGDVRGTVETMCSKVFDFVYRGDDGAFCNEDVSNARWG
ncbi:hypothetical protein JW721_03490 [Candidatus Micrarchaeota archaeon]|nr:hypothetical protein [Candidatus Micrarchaeota archaeon]